MKNDTDIILCGPFVVRDSGKVEHKVKQIRIFDEGYGMLDVYVDFVAALEPGQHRDKVLIEEIMAKLRSLGYVGPNFGLSDPGLQERKLIVLEASEEFCTFAKRFGWKDLSEEFN
jgi:hypothetical protein